MATTKIPAFALELKITLLGTKPPIWRRLQVPGALRLESLHGAIQTAMGWCGGHLHQFEQGDEVWGALEDAEIGGLDVMDESKVTIAELLGAKGDWLRYVYDFGDYWEHKVVVEKVIPLPLALKAPVCTGGARRCPPEDVGGPPGFADFIETISDPSHEDHEYLLNWAGGTFDPKEFDKEEVNEVLASYKWPLRQKR